MMRLSKRFKMVLIGMLVMVVSLSTAYSGLYGWIQWDAHQKAAEVWADYPQTKDAVEALIMRMRSDNSPMAERNMAVWTLGRLADRQALDALEREYTGQPCDHDIFLCQSELKKAIQRCGGQI